ncbi:hypothetical protein GCM10009804_39210 [Kribbella hippodromi]|uniref:Secreted protein n=1 Tax=Kribbella hippodromi TaxID=434347 RepID=A0ABP4PGS8_9ACTN
MSMLFGTTILCDACALVAALDPGVVTAPFARASGSILRGLDRLFLLSRVVVTLSMLAVPSDRLTRNSSGHAPRRPNW